MSESPKAIFLSYASQDLEPARRICHALQAAGLEVWFDQSELRGGDAWDAAIRRQVKECALFVPLVSANTDARSEGYFRREWNLAVGRMLDMADDQAFLLPVVIDGTAEAAARVPDRFRERQWTRLPGGEAPKEFVERVARLLSGGPAAGARKPAAGRAAAPSQSPPADEGFWVAVLPFRYRGADADIAALAEGLSEEIVTGLSRFSYLRVIARSSTMRFTGETHDARAAGKELGARYVMEGNLRQAGAQLRVAVQLVDATTGAHLWAETYERPFRAEDMFALQDDLVPRIVSTVADWAGVLPRALSEAVRSKATDALSPYEAVLRGCGYYQRVRPDEHLAVRSCLERAVEAAPQYADAWVMLSMICGEEHRFGFNVKPDPLGRALEAARRAADAAPSNHLSHLALAQAHYFRRELDAFRNAAERAVALNPMDGFTVEYLGHLMAFAGNWERGRELGDRARQLNPHHPAWYWALPMLDAFRRGDYREARAFIPKAVMPGQYYALALFAAIYGQLGEREAAGEALREVLALKPDFAEVARDQFGTWYLPPLVEQLIDGLRKAGLEVPAAPSSSTSTTDSHAPSALPSGAARVDEGFWVAVLPFRHGGASGDIAALADALSEGIVMGMLRFPYLRVIARSSTLRYTSETADVRAIGSELGARYVIEGTLRQAGSKVRIAVQLVDTQSGAHLWAETYDRPFSPEGILELQDDLVPLIVSTVADAHGVLPRALGEALRNRSPEELSPYEAVLRSFSYFERLTMEEFVASRTALERAVALAPGYSYAWAALALIIENEYALGLKGKPDPLGRGLQAARKAVEADPSNHRAHQVLAEILFFRREIPAFRTAAKRALELNSMDSCGVASLGGFIAYAGEWERGCALVHQALRLNPHHPGWYWFPLVFHAYRERDYRNALDLALRIDLPGYRDTQAVLAAVYGQLGEHKAATRCLRELLALEPQFALEARTEFGKFLDPELVEHVIDGLRKAGLEIPRPAAEAAQAEALVGEPTQATPAPAATSVSTSSRTPLVGRDAERSRLDQMLEAARQGRGGLVLLGGEPGVGKTRLASEILEDGRARGMLALAGHAYEEETAPWMTSREILQEMVRLLPAGDLRRMLGDNASELSRLLPELRRLFADIPEPEELPPQQQRRHLFNGVVQFFGRASATTPMVMLLDDLHWADESSLLLLEHIAARLAEMRILMVGTYRDAEADMGAAFTKTLAALVRQRQAERLQVKQLDVAAVAALLRALAGSEPPLPLAKAIHRETEGNAFFVEEVFRHLSEEGALFDAEGRWKPDLDLERLDVPEGVRLVTARRLERLKEGTVKTLTLAAGVGLRFELRILEAASTDSGAVIDEVEEAEAAQLVRPIGGGREVLYEFSHALVRQTLLSALSAPRLQRLHLRLADAMERVHGAKVAEHAPELAHQLDAAGAAAAPERVRRYLQLAGDQARAAVATEEALGYFKKALALEEGMNPAERADLLFKRGEASRTLGRWSEAEADWLEALPVLESEGRTELVMRICTDLSYQSLWQRRLDFGRTIASRGLKSAGEEVSAGRCRLYAMLGAIDTLTSHFDQADQLLADATTMAEALGDEGLLGGEVLLNVLQLCHHTLQPTKMVKTAERALLLARRSSRPWDLSSVLGFSMMAWCFTSQFERASAAADEAEALGRQEGDLGTIGHAFLARAFAGIAAGDLAAARSRFEQVVRLWGEAGFPWVTVMWAFLGSAARLQGDLPGARQAMDQAMRSPLAGSFGGTEESYLLLLESYAGDASAAARLDRLSAGLPRPGVTNGVGAWLVLQASVEAAGLLGRREQAAALYPLVRELMQKGAVTPFCHGLVEKAAGIAAAAGGDWHQAQEHFENALRTAHEIPHRVEQPEVRRWYAWMLLDRDAPGDRERARTLLAEARAAYETIGMPKHVAMVDELLKGAS